MWCDCNTSSDRGKRRLGASILKRRTPSYFGGSPLFVGTAAPSRQPAQISKTPKSHNFGLQSEFIIILMGYSVPQFVPLRVPPNPHQGHASLLCVRVWRRGFQPRQPRGSMPKGVRRSVTDKHTPHPGGPSLRDGQAIAASLVTVFTLLCSVAERRSPLTHPTNPLYTFYMFSTANHLCALCLSAPLREISHAPPEVHATHLAR